jgi:outer membrane protein assembly factor BamB
MAAPTPAADDKYVVAMFATFDLACFNHDGNLVWFRSLTSDYTTVGNNVGMASSPVLWRDLVILAVENAGESFGIAIDKNTGENRWKIERSRKINWTTPLVYTNNGRDEVVFQSGDNLAGYDPATGKERWSITSQSFSTIPSPVFGNGLLYVPGPKFLAIRPGTDKADAQVVWEESLSTGYSSPLYHDRLLYTLASRGVLNCVEAATGKKVYSQRVQGTFAASPLLADGKLYLVAEEGDTTVVQAGPEATVLSVNSLNDKLLASPVAANGAIYLRSDNYLYCVANKK